jgi:hypothetical protein
MLVLKKIDMKEFRKIFGKKVKFFVKIPVEGYNGYVIAGNISIDSVELAQKMYDKNIEKNRGFSNKNLNNLKYELFNDPIFTGEPIIFTDKLVLINGQHRLQAILNGIKKDEKEIKIPIIIHVIIGISIEAFSKLDSGKNRSLDERLTIHSDRIINKKLLTIINWSLEASPFEGRRNKERITQEQADEFYKLNKDSLMKTISFIPDKKIPKIINQFFVGSIFEYVKINYEKAKCFTQSIFDIDSGKGLGDSFNKDHYMIKLYKFLTHKKSSQRCVTMEEKVGRLWWVMKRHYKNEEIIIPKLGICKLEECNFEGGGKIEKI